MNNNESLVMVHLLKKDLLNKNELKVHTATITFSLANTLKCT